MSVDVHVRLPPCSQLFAEVEALSRLSLSHVRTPRFDFNKALEVILGIPSSRSSSPCNVYVIGAENMISGHNSRSPSPAEDSEDEDPAVPLFSITSPQGADPDDDDDDDEEAGGEFRYHPDFPYLEQSSKPLQSVRMPELDSYSFSEATPPKPQVPKLAEAFFPRPFTFFEKEVTDPTMPKDRCCEDCLHTAASRIKSHIERRVKKRHNRASNQHFGKKKKDILLPHSQAILPPPFVIDFESTDASPDSLGVPLTDIRGLKASMLGANETVFDDSPHEADAITLVVQFEGHEEWLVPITVGCDCGEITRASLALIIADLVHDYHKKFGMGSTRHLRLCSLSVSPDLDYWYATYAQVQGAGEISVPRLSLLCPAARDPPGENLKDVPRL